jgi:hypothetical protein
MLEEGHTLLDDVVLALVARDCFLKLTKRHGDNAIYFYELGASLPTGRNPASHAAIRRRLGAR